MRQTSTTTMSKDVEPKKRKRTRKPDTPYPAYWKDRKPDVVNHPNKWAIK